MSKPIDQKLLEMRNGFTAVSSAIEAIANNPLTAPDVNNILDRKSIWKIKIQGGRIAQFSSAGIKDTASDFVLRVTNDGITVDTAHVNSIPNALSVGGDLTVAGEVHATRLHVDEVVADIRNETTSNLEFRAEGGSVSNKGLIWSGEGNTRQFTMQGDRLFSSHSIDLHKKSKF